MYHRRRWPHCLLTIDGLRTVNKMPPTPRLPRARRTDARRRSMKRAELVALQIVEDIVSQGLQAGAKLPLEADMLKEKDDD